MWIASEIGFFSVVAKPWDRPRGTLTVRARVREDLDALRSKYLPDLSTTKYDPGADYWYRGVAPRASVMSAMAALVGDLDYPDYKSRVEEVQGIERATVYASVWAALRRLQKPQIPPDTPIIFASIGHRPDVLDDGDDRPLPHDPSKGPA